MQKLTSTIRFVSPAFLGDARQQGAWRTPPIKASLREWWRLWMASAHGLDHREIRAREAQLFGNALPDQTPMQSRVRLRLSQWSRGRLTSDQFRPVGSIQNGKARVDAALYLGYGPVAHDKSKGTILDHGPAIDAEEQAELRVGIRCAEREEVGSILQALSLMNRFATIGGRSRNGWGSFALSGNDLPAIDFKRLLVPYCEGLESAWPCGIGTDDNGPLIWRTAPARDWRGAMKTLAQTRSDLNRLFEKNTDRALVNYPVTKKTIDAWSKNFRLPNSLRFKIMDSPEGLRGQILHIPVCPPEEAWRKHPMSRERDGLTRLWARVHSALDQAGDYERVSP